MVKDAGLRYSVNRFLIWRDFGFLVNNRMYDLIKLLLIVWDCVFRVSKDK